MTGASTACVSQGCQQKTVATSDTTAQFLFWVYCRAQKPATLTLYFIFFFLLFELSRCHTYEPPTTEEEWLRAPVEETAAEDEGGTEETMAAVVDLER